MRNIHTRIALPIAVLLVVNLVVTAWVMWDHLAKDITTSLHDYAASLNRMLATSLRESMRKNDREHLRQTIHDVGEMEWVKVVRVVDKEGRISFSSDSEETGQIVSRASETCRACHRHDPILTSRITVMGAARGSSSTLQAAEAIRMEKDCVSCHDSEIGRPLGVLVVDLNVGPLVQNISERATRNLWVLLAGSVFLLGILIFAIRKIVVTRLHGLSETLTALREGRPIPSQGDAPVDEIDVLRETITALGSDLEARRFAGEIGRRIERALNGSGMSVMLLDERGRVLLANADAQNLLAADFASLAGREYAELDGLRKEIWHRSRDDEVVLHPADRSSRGTEGAEIVLLAMKDPEEEKRTAYLEIARKPAKQEPSGENDRKATGPVGIPRNFMQTPYRPADAGGDRLLRAVLLMGGLTPDHLASGGRLELDPTLASGMRTFEGLLDIREVIDSQVAVCDMGQLTRGVARDFQYSREEKLRWHLLLSEKAMVVAHPVLLQQMVLLLLEMAAPRSRNVVVFLQPQIQAPKFFLGVWSDREAAEPPEPVRWETCMEIAERFNGSLEFNASYDLTEMKQVYPGRLGSLKKGILFLAEFPRTLG